MFPDLIIPEGQPEGQEDASQEDGAGSESDAENAAEAATGDQPGEPVAAVDAGAEPAAGDAAESGGATASPAASEPAEVAAEESAGSDPEADRKDPAAAPLLASRETGAQPESATVEGDGEVDQTEAFTSVFAVGTGLAVALVLLFGLTLVVLRPQ
jgi:hypothetical protein